MNRKDTLDKAAECVLRDRQADHGKPEDTFATIADLWSVYLSARNGVDICIGAADVAMMQLLLKVARQAGNKSHEDNYVDMAGYAACAAELAAPAARIKIDRTAAMPRMAEPPQFGL